MSRTYKDAPRKVRERRLGISDEHENCPLCADGAERTATFGFTAIFFAHELREIEEFIALAEERGYEARSEEVRGYLGTGKVAEEELLGLHRRKTIFDDHFDRKRALYSQPRGIDENLLWDLKGRPSAPQQTGSPRPFRSQSVRDYFDQFLDRAHHVSTKQNIFVVVSVTRTIERGRRFHYHETSGALDYLLSHGNCHCSQCEPSEKITKARIRAVTGQLQRVFNSGDYEALEEVAAELVRTNPGGYRDQSYC